MHDLAGLEQDFPAVDGEQERAACTQEVDDPAVSFEDRLPGETFNLRCETTGVVNWTIDLRALHLCAEHPRGSKLVIDGR